MYLDAQNEPSDAQAVTASAISENVIDMGVSGVKLGAGTPKFIEVAVDTLVESAGDSTLVVTVESSDAVGLTSTNTHATSATIAKATLVAGYKIRLHLDPNVVMKRYLGLRYTVATANFTAGNFSSYVAPVEQNADTYVGQT